MLFSFYIILRIITQLYYIVVDSAALFICRLIDRDEEEMPRLLTVEYLLNAFNGKPLCSLQRTEQTTRLKTIYRSIISLTPSAIFKG